MKTNEILSALVPRFINDVVALSAVNDQYEIVCSMIDIIPGERYDAMCDLKIFTWLGFAIPCGEPTNIRPFEVREAL
ncbi:hypothetical protein ACUMLB_003455 [Escherichia coli]|nr:hypothetical protein [Escherichia coli]EJI0954884.1 hypothetical protein [Escherichia coli]EKG6774971.1 hypothetical protein [Escherichia coli]ELX1524402.1 hypothetical protein [Escherichia coli]